MPEPTANSTNHSRAPIMAGAAAVALVSTAAAYSAMVGFGTDVLAMSTGTAYAFAGVFELSLVTVALMAREAAQHDRDAHTLLTLTWVLSAASGTFAAWHELHEGHPIPAAGFRLAVPLLAALMWHLALIGDRHLASARTWSQLRTAARMHALFLTTEAAHRAHHAHERVGSRATARRAARAEARRLRARSLALRTIDPADMDREVTAWLAALDSVNRGSAHVASRSWQASPERPDTAVRPDAEALTGPDTAAVPEPRAIPGGRASAELADTSSVSPDTAADAVALRSQGLTVPEVAARLGVSDRTVRRWTNPMPTDTGSASAVSPDSAPDTTPDTSADIAVEVA